MRREGGGEGILQEEKCTLVSQQQLMCVHWLHLLLGLTERLYTAILWGGGAPADMSVTVQYTNYYRLPAIYEPFILWVKIIKIHWGRCSSWSRLALYASFKGAVFSQVF